jgi:hypothetical protein
MPGDDMRHVPTVAELAEEMGFSQDYSADYYNVAVVLTEIIEQLKSHSACEDFASRFSRDQLASAMGIVLALVTTHELAQAERERITQ